MTIDKPSPMLRQLHIDQFARPLMFVKAINIIVLIFWLQAFGVVMATAFTGGFIGAIYKLPFMFALGFPAWVFWRSPDATSTVSDPLMRVSYLVLGAICLIVVLIAGFALMGPYISDTNDIDDTTPGILLGLFTQFFFWGILTLLATISLKRLRRTKVDKIGITLEELARSMSPTRAKQTLWFTTAQNLKSPEALRFIVIAVVLSVIYSVIYIYLRSEFEEMDAGQSEYPSIAGKLKSLKLAADLCFLGACYFLLRARAKLQPTAESVLSTDTRAPVLLLRSFVDDERVRFRFSERTLFDFSLGARLATHFFKTGPFIAVDSPNHTPAIGAARASLTDTEWQGTVVEWMRAARLIVLLAGVSLWIRWEMRQIVELGYGRKLIILMPELSRWKQFRLRLTRGLSSATDIARKRLEVIRETFSGSPWETSINEPCAPEKVRSLTFGPDGQVTAVCARSRSRDCYELAALISEYLICKEQKNEVREA
jgi:hypothetical protein